MPRRVQPLGIALARRQQDWPLAPIASQADGGDPGTDYWLRADPVHLKLEGGRLVLTRTRDGGKSFEVLSRGLPQEHAYDVVYLHALALDPSGNRLAFGSTTGGLWVSEDQGDSWAEISHTLPPVYAVRFA